MINSSKQDASSTKSDTENPYKKSCFVISRIGSRGSPEYSDSLTVLNYIIKPVLEPLGYEVTRQDSSPANNILKDIVKRLIEADIVIADISGSNLNVFYELGIRNSAGKPYITLLRKGERPPFDVTIFKYTLYDLSDVEVTESAKEELKERVQFSESKPGEASESPVSQLRDISYLRFNGDA